MKVALVCPHQKGRRVSFRVETKTFVDAEKGIVVMTAFPHRYQAVEMAERLYYGIDEICLKDGDLFGKLLMPKKGVAVARCVGGDVCDEKTGKDIAYKKLNEKVRKAVKARFTILAKELQKTADSLLSFE